MQRLPTDQHPQFKDGSTPSAGGQTFGRGSESQAVQANENQVTQKYDGGAGKENMSQNDSKFDIENFK